MSKIFEWKQDYYHRDKSYGLNDWDAVAAFVRGLLENSEDRGFCWPNVRMRVMADNFLLSQTFIQRLGQMRDARGIPIIAEKLTAIGEKDMSIVSPWCPMPKYLELICLRSLAMIGGPEAGKTIDQYRNNPKKAYLSADLQSLQISDKPGKVVAPYPDDYPQILKQVRSYHDVLGDGGCSMFFTPEQAEDVIKKLHNLKWRGVIEILSGDGYTTTFKLKNKINEHIHNYADPFSDFGIFISNPKVEYPIGRRRWANSHTFLYFPVADGSLYGNEYTWSVEENTITTHFHEHILLEEVVVNSDGGSVTVKNTPVSTGVEVRGNVFSRKCSSAVRGIWDNPAKEGKNYYVQRANILTPYRKLYYFKPLHSNIVNQLGIWAVHEDEHPERFFDHAGDCINVAGVVEELLIPLHEPKILAWNFEQYKPACPRDKFVSRLMERMRVDLAAVPDASILDGLIGVEFEHSKCGHAGVQQGNDNGYRNGLDLDCNGIIDEDDKKILAQHTGEVYRMNTGDFGYFGSDWMSLGNVCRSHNLLIEPAIFICCYDYGAGYNTDTGTVYLFEKLPSGKRLYIEYFCDVPPAAGKNNVKVYLQPDIEG